MEQQKSYRNIRFLILIAVMSVMLVYFCLYVLPDYPQTTKRTTKVTSEFTPKVTADPALVALREKLKASRTIIHAGGALIDSEGKSTRIPMHLRPFHGLMNRETVLLNWIFHTPRTAKPYACINGQKD